MQVLCGTSWVELGRGVCSYKVLGSCGSALVCERMIILLGKQIIYCSSSILGNYKSNTPIYLIIYNFEQKLSRLLISFVKGVSYTHEAKYSMAYVA